MAKKSVIVDEEYFHALRQPIVRGRIRCAQTPITGLRCIKDGVASAPWQPPHFCPIDGLGRGRVLTYAATPHSYRICRDGFSPRLSSGWHLNYADIAGITRWEAGVVYIYKNIPGPPKPERFHHHYRVNRAGPGRFNVIRIPIKTICRCTFGLTVFLYDCWYCCRA